MKFDFSIKENLVYLPNRSFCNMAKTPNDAASNVC